MGQGPWIHKQQASTTNKQATSRQTNEQGSWTMYHGPTHKQNLPLKVLGSWTLEQVSWTTDQGPWLR